MLLAVDVGNTQTIFGLYEGERLGERYRIATEAQRTGDELGALLDDFLDYDALDGISLSSTVPRLIREYEHVAERWAKVPLLVIGPGVKTGMPILYDNPREVGADRIVNAVAAFERWRTALIVVDFGTATTFDAVSPKGEYLGGAICPGISISMEALFRHASKLPRVEFIRPANVVGKNTVASMQSGLVYGYVGLVDGICERMSAELGSSPRVVATGGLAGLVAGVSRAISEVDEHLTLDGLRILHERNR